VKATVARIMLMVRTPHEVLRRLTAAQLVSNGFCDPVRLFIKNEMHPIEKVRNRRFRIIYGITIVDQLVCKFVSQISNDAEIACNAVHGKDIPSACGNGLNTPDELSRLAEQLLRWNKPFYDTDVSGWDFGVPGWLLEEEVTMRIDLTKTKGTPFERVARNQMFVQSLSVLVLPNGEAFSQTVPGIQKSGSNTTSSGNSRMRAFVARLVGSDLSVHTGDDSVETYPGSEEQLVAAYRELGIRVTDAHYRACEDHLIEFCSKEISYSTMAEIPAIPLSWARMTARAMWSSDPLEGVLDELSSDLLWHPNRKNLLAAVAWVHTGCKTQ
jgi:hypothetical protein